MRNRSADHDSMIYIHSRNNSARNPVAPRVPGILILARKTRGQAPEFALPERCARRAARATIAKESR
jgi:hypothetical protein